MQSDRELKQHQVRYFENDGCGTDKTRAEKERSSWRSEVGRKRMCEEFSVREAIKQ
jgi:hypothetical protein